MQALEWAILYPERVQRVISIGVARLGAMGLGLNHLQRQAIQLDPAWKGGHYSPDAPPTQGLALARALAVCTYKSADLFEERFARKPDRNGRRSLRLADSRAAKPQARTAAASTSPATSTTRATASTSASTPTPTSPSPAPWTSSTLPAATHQLPTPTAASRPHVTLVGISSDWLFPPEDIVALSPPHQRRRRALRLP